MKIQYKIMLIVISSIMLIGLCLGCYKSPENIYRGVYDHVEYSTGGFGHPDITVVYFREGKTIILENLHSMNFQKGDSIEIITLKNTHPERLVNLRKMPYANN